MDLLLLDIKQNTRKFNSLMELLKLFKTKSILIDGLELWKCQVSLIIYLGLHLENGVCVYIKCFTNVV